MQPQPHKSRNIDKRYGNRIKDNVVCGVRRTPYTMNLNEPH